jgi:protein CpxP
MKKLIFTTLCLVCMMTMSFAQKTDDKSRKTPQEKAQHATDELSKKLSLTADQKSKIYAINLESSTKTKDAKKSGKKDKSAGKAEKEQKISAVLNDTQRKTYEDIKAKKEAKKAKKEAKKGDHKKA